MAPSLETTPREAQMAPTMELTALMELKLLATALAEIDATALTSLTKPLTEQS